MYTLVVTLKESKSSYEILSDIKVAKCMLRRMLCEHMSTIQINYAMNEYSPAYAAAYVVQYNRTAYIRDTHAKRDDVLLYHH